MGKSVLITGGAGFIGGHVVEHLVHAGHNVTVFDRFNYAGKGKNLSGVLANVDLVIGDTATSDLEYRLGDRKFDAVVHMASETHVDRAIEDPTSFQVSNVVGTSRLLDYLAKKQSPNRVIVYSTDEVFGTTPDGQIFDESTPFRPSNAYSASKVGMEGLATSFFITHKLPTIIVRPCNTYGPRQHPEKVIPKFTRQILTHQPVTLYNDGKGARDWLHAADHARAVELLLHEGHPGESYNLAAGEEHSDEDIYRRIVDELKFRDYDTTHELTYVPGRPGHDRRYFMDGSKLRALGWAPKVPFDDGFRQTVLWNALHLEEHWKDDVVRAGK